MEDSCNVDNRNMNLVERLISEVASRPLLWNRYHNDYNNRAAMDFEWEKIAIILKKDKEFVKQKWRNLRDQFQRESKKVIVPFHNPTKPYIKYYRGKWMYFKDLLFLKDVTVLKKATGNDCYSPPQEMEIREDFIKEELIVFEDDDDMFAEQVNNYNNESDNNEKETLITSPSLEDTQNTLIIQPKVEIVEEVQLEEIGGKRKLSEIMPEPVVPAKSQRPAVADASSNTEDQCEIDDDLHFVKSLVPYLRKLSPIRKLLVRNEIQSLLIRESLCENCKFGNSLSHNS